MAQRDLPVRPQRSPVRRPLRACRGAAAASTLVAVALLVVAPAGARHAALITPWTGLVVAVPVILLAGALLAAARHLVVEVRLAGHPLALRGIDAALPLVLVAAPAPWVLAAMLVATAPASLHGRRAWRVADFDALGSVTAAAVALSTVLGTSLLAGVEHGRLPAAVLGGVAAALAGELLNAQAVAATAHRSVRGLLRPRVSPVALQSATMGGLGVLVAWLARYAPAGLTGLVVPAVLVVAVVQLQRDRDAEARLYASLSAEQDHMSGRTNDESARAMLVTTARLLGGADVELLVAGPEGLVRYLGDEAGVASRVAVPPEALSDPYVLDLLAGDGVRSWHDDAGSRPAIGFSVGTRGSASVGSLVIAVARRPLGGPAFGVHDVRLAKALSTQAGSWLAAGRSSAPATPAVGSQEPAPAGQNDALRTRQFIVREAATRLTAAAGSPDPDPDRLADELRLVQRAVAALVGERRRGRAAPRHASGGREQGNGDADGAWDGTEVGRRGTDWTTTGLLSTGPEASAGAASGPRPDEAPVVNSLVAPLVLAPAAKP